MNKKDVSQYKEINGKIYRKNAAIIVYNSEGKVLFAKRSKTKGNISWQFPQGGIDQGEAASFAALRELEEETGISNAKIMFEDDIWREYNFEKPSFKNPQIICDGQIQKWFLVKLLNDDEKIKMQKTEFDDYKWIKLEDININEIYSVKQKTYKDVIEKFTPILNNLIKNDM